MPLVKRPVKNTKPEKHWLLELFLPAEESAFTSASAQFGDSFEATIAYFLNCWALTPNGTRWFLDESIPLTDGIVHDPDLYPVFSMTVRSAWTGVEKRAVKDFKKDMRLAIAESVREQMLIFGLTIYFEKATPP